MKKWTMPKWMRRFAPYVTNTGGNDIEEMYNDQTDPRVNLPRSTLAACVKSQIGMLYRLNDARELRGEQRHTFYLGVSKDSHRDDVYHLFPTEGSALKWAAEEINAMRKGNRTVTNVLRQSMEADGWRFCTTVGEERSVSVHSVKLNALRL